MKYILLPSATKLRRLCFYTCLSFCVHRGRGLPQCMRGYHPPRPGIPPVTRPPGTRHPPGPDPPWDQAPLWEQTPPGTRHPPRGPGTPSLTTRPLCPLPPRPGIPRIRDGYHCGRYASNWNAFLF